MSINLYISKKKAFNPFSQYRFCVSRLTTLCHLRHPNKANLVKMKTIWTSVSVFVCPNNSCIMIQTEPRRHHSMFFAEILPIGLWIWFCKDWQNPLSILIPNLLRFFSLQIFASKGFKSRHFFWACDCVYETSVLIRLQESRKRFGPFEIISSKKWSNDFFNDIIKSVWFSRICQYVLNCCTRFVAKGIRILLSKVALRSCWFLDYARIPSPPPARAQVR